MEIVSPHETLHHFEDLYNTMKIRYGDMKKQLAEDMIVFTAPLREKILSIASDDQFIHKVATQGAEKARASASKTLSEARKLIGFRSF
jgi:tryptophanyl-tRNA synthetase